MSLWCRLRPAYPGWATGAVAALVGGVAAPFVHHMVYVHFDYGLQVAVNAALFAAFLAVWLDWFVREGWGAAPYAALVPGFAALSLAACACEVLHNAPPWGRWLDGHALWHLGSIPAAAVWWRFIVHYARDTGPLPAV